MKKHKLFIFLYLLLLLILFLIFRNKDKKKDNYEITRKNLVSVIILNYNRPHNLDILIPKLINYKNVGEIIISHGKKDTEKLINNSKVINETKYRNKYFSATRYFLAEKANYDLILYLDDDIIITEEQLQKLIDSYVKNGSNNLYGPCQRFCDSSGYYFENPKTNNSNILLTGISLLNKKISVQVLEKMKKNKYFDIVIKNKGNCEDILFSTTLRNSGLGKLIHVDFKYEELDNKNGYSSLEDHYKIRSDFCRNLNNN